MSDGPDEQWEREQAEDAAAEAAAKAARDARAAAFVEGLNALCAEHGLHIEFWATYADDSFFGVEDGAKAYEFDTSRIAREYELKVVDR